MIIGDDGGPGQSHRRGNLLLPMLPDENYRSLWPSLELVRLNARQVLVLAGNPVSHVYFPCDCVVSMVITLHDGTAVEIGSIGKEGFCGIEALTGADYASATMVCQVSGNSLRMRAPDFRDMARVDGPLRMLAQRYLQVYINQMAQYVACNRLHGISQRFAAWMLMIHDRVEGDRFKLTQEFIATMLGVHRSSVSEVAAQFQHLGMIRYSRGSMVILDRPQLERSCCECYAMATGHYVRLLGLKATKCALH